MKIAISVEASPARGMGHLYRALHMVSFLTAHHENCFIILNNDPVSIRLMEKQGIAFEIVNYQNEDSGWEQQLIQHYSLDIWILDRFSTSWKMAKNIKQSGVLLVAIDDCGEGAKLVDLHFCGMLFESLCGKQIFRGEDYLILNPEIARFRRKRTHLTKILVTLGGSDTYGITPAIVDLLERNGYSADIVIGPNYQHETQLAAVLNERFQVYRSVSSLVAFMEAYDFAITGGGVTCFETSASGLPSIIVATEKHEIPIGHYIASFGGSLYAGYYPNIDETLFDFHRLPIATMSEKALRAFHLHGMENIYNQIRKSVFNE